MWWKIVFPHGPAARKREKKQTNQGRVLSQIPGGCLLKMKMCPWSTSSIRLKMKKKRPIRLCSKCSKKKTFLSPTQVASVVKLVGELSFHLQLLTNTGKQRGTMWLSKIWQSFQKITPPKTNMDTQNDGLFNVSPFKYGYFGNLC